MNTLSPATIKRAQDIAQGIEDCKETLYCSEATLSIDEKMELSEYLDSEYSRLSFLIANNTG